MSVGSCGQNENVNWIFQSYIDSCIYLFLIDISAWVNFCKFVTMVTNTCRCSSLPSKETSMLSVGLKYQVTWVVEFCPIQVTAVLKLTLFWYLHLTIMKTKYLTIKACLQKLRIQPAPVVHASTPAGSVPACIL